MSFFYLMTMPRLMQYLFMFTFKYMLIQAHINYFGKSNNVLQYLVTEFIIL